MEKVITISGKAQHGKDSLAICLKEALEKRGEKVLIINYADYLKFICKKYFDWDGIKDENGRTILQHVGTDLIRKKRPDFWVETVANFIYAIEEEFDWFLIPDTRFPNEIEYMKNIFGKKHTSVRVLRKNEDGTEFDNGLTETQKSHMSEIALDEYDDFDRIIVNDGTLQDLYQMGLMLLYHFERNWI